MSDTTDDPIEQAQEALDAAKTEVAEAQAQAASATTTRAHLHSRIDHHMAQFTLDLHNSPVSRSTEAWNHLHAVLPGLSAAIKKEI